MVVEASTATDKACLSCLSSTSSTLEGIEEFYVANRKIALMPILQENYSLEQPSAARTAHWISRANDALYHDPMRTRSYVDHQEKCPCVP